MIFFCGDPHASFRHIIESVLTHRPDAVILLGDNTPEKPLDVELAPILDLTEIWWIHGNHDTDKERAYDNLFGSKLAHRNLHGRVVDIAGVRIAGFGGIFRTKVWDGKEASMLSPEAYLKTCDNQSRWRNGMPLRHRSTIFPSELAALSRETAQVLVTHEAPDLHPFGNAALTLLAKKLKVEAAFHGHHHENIDYPNSVWRGVGLRGITRLDGNIIRPGEREEC